MIVDPKLKILQIKYTRSNEVCRSWKKMQMKVYVILFCWLMENYNWKEVINMEVNGVWRDT